MNKIIKVDNFIVPSKQGQSQQIIYVTDVSFHYIHKFHHLFRLFYCLQLKMIEQYLHNLYTYPYISWKNNYLIITGSGFQNFYYIEMNETPKYHASRPTKKRRIKSQQDYQTDHMHSTQKISIEVQLPQKQPLRMIFRKGTPITQIKYELKRKLGKGAIYYTINMDHNIDYCLEEEIGDIHSSLRLRYQFLDHQLNETNNLHAYKIYRCISVGGFSKVFLVRSKKDGKFYAAKFIDKSLNEDKKFVDMIENEREINISLDHPFICKMHNFIESPNFYIFILDYCPGGQLFGLMKRHRDMTEYQAKFYFLETIFAINYMHQRRIIYRDIKPQNILIDKKGHIKIADFGLAKVIKSKCHSYCGSLEYMAPQIVRGDQYDFGIDHYCLGSLLFQLMIGCPPFYNPEFLPEQTKQHIMNSEVKFPYSKKLSYEFKDFVSKLLDKNPKKRLGSFGGIKQILSHPWIGKFNKQSLQKYRIASPFHHNLAENHFQTEYLPNDEILETIKKIKSDLKGILYQKQQKRQKSPSTTQIRGVKKRPSNSGVIKSNKCGRNLSSMLNFGIKVQRTKEKRRTKSSEDCDSRQYKDMLRKQNKKIKLSSQLIKSSSVNLSVYLQKTMHNSFSISKKDRSISRNSRDGVNKKVFNIMPFNKMVQKKNTKMVEANGLKKSGKQGKQNLFKFKFQQKSHMQGKNLLRASDAPNRNL